MPDIKILHSADFHIGASESFLGERAPSRRAETLLTFEKTVDFAKAEGVKLFLIAGDLIDSNNIENSFCERILEKISEAKETEFVYSAGNHDPLNAQSPFLRAKIPQNFHILPAKDSCIEPIKGVKVYGRSFSEALMGGESRFKIAPDSECINIMCIHGEYGMSGEHNPINEEFVIKSGMDYIALGHVHKRTLPQKVGNTYIAYSGCPEGQGFDETGEKGVYIGTVSGGNAELSFVPMAKRMHICESIDVSGMQSISEIYEKTVSVLKEKYGEAFGDNLYKIILKGELTEQVNLDKTELAERLKAVTYYSKVYDRTSLKFDLPVLSREKSLKGIFVKNMLEKIEAEPQNEELLQKALKIGLKAFSGEVRFDEDN